MKSLRLGLLFLTDGRRECAKVTLESLFGLVPAELFDERIVVDDGANPAYSDWLDTWNWTEHLPPGRRKRGFGGAIRAGWEAYANKDVDYILHMEDDYLMNRYFAIEHMIAILERNEDIAQIALRRQPWGSDADHPGGFIGKDPEAFIENIEPEGIRWMEHSKFFTTNPSIYRKELIEVGWPEGDHSEGAFSAKLSAMGYHFAYMGHRHDEPWVIHIGEQRAGTGY